MITEDKKELEIALTTYISLKRNQAECTGFIDGFEVAIKYLRQRQILPIDSVTQQSELLKGFVDWFNKTDKTQAILNERVVEYLKTLL